MEPGGAEIITFPKDKEFGYKELQEFTDKLHTEGKIKKRDLEKNNKNPDLNARYPNQYLAQIGNLAIDIQITDEDSPKDKVEIDGEERDVIARMWLTDEKDKDGEWGTCLKLTKNSEGKEGWVAQHTQLKPRHDKEKETAFWKFEEQNEPIVNTNYMSAIRAILESQEPKYSPPQE